MSFRKPPNILLFSIFVLAVFLRFYHIHTQGFFLHDEAVMFNRAGTLQSMFFSGVKDVPLNVRYVDSKILWLILLGIAQRIFDNAYCSGQIVSALFGIAGVVLTYLFSKEFYQSKIIALGSAFFLSVSALHVLYSRLTLPESASAFLVILSLYFYLKGLKGRTRHIIISGLIAGAAILVNRYRVLLLPLFALIFELYAYRNQDEDNKKSILRYPIFFATMVAPLLLYQCSFYILDHFGVSIPSYVHAIKKSMSHHEVIMPGLFSFLTYPFYIWKFEGAAVCGLVVLSMFFVKKKESSSIPLIFLLLQIFVSSIVDEKSVRSIVVVLPFVAILCSLSLYHIYNFFQKTLFQRIVVYALIGLSCILCVMKSSEVVKYKSGMEEAMLWFKSNFEDRRILAVNPIALVYEPKGRLIPFNYKYDYDIRTLRAVGMEFLVMDPQAFCLALLGQKFLSSSKFTSLYNEVQTSCVPIAVFDNYNIKLQHWLLLEHTSDLKDAISWIKQANEDTGKIKIYKLDQCYGK